MNSDQPVRFVILLLVSALGAVAATVNRVVVVDAPAEVLPGSKAVVRFNVSTDAGQGERIGFLHAEYSADERHTWIPLVMEQELGTRELRQVEIPADGTGQIVVRVRVAFRGGLAGDVDYRGAALRWTSDWKDWRSPPTKVVVIKIGRP